MEDRDLAGELIGGRWRVDELIGHGGFGRVFRCSDESDIGLGPAAVKVLHPNTSPLERNEFLREVQKIATLRHQNLVGYLDSGVHDLSGEPHPFLVTELCNGSLADHLTSMPGHRMSTEQAIAALIHMAAGLAHLHDRQLIHRDLKPGNVLYGDGAWKLADFGLMRDLTATGSYHRGDAITGTPLFMAPELFATMTATAPSDVYALGVMAHMMAAGRTVHAGSGQALIHAVTTTPPVIDDSIDPALRTLLSEALRRDPQQRITARAFHDRLLSPADPARGANAAPPAAFHQPTVQHAEAQQQGRPHPGTHQTWQTAGAPAPQGGPQPLQHWAPQPSQHQAPVPEVLTPGEEPARNRGALIALGVLGAVGLFVVLAIVGSALLLLSGTDDGEQLTISSQRDDVEPAQPAAAQGGPDSNEESEATGGVDIGDGVEIGEGVVIGGSESAGGDDGDPAAVPEPIVNPEFHLEDVPCESGLADQVIITNRHDRHVDYSMDINYFDGDGTRISDESGSLLALAPGAKASLDMESSEEGAVSCELVGMELVPTDQRIIAQREFAEITSCEADGNWHEIVVNATNPETEIIDARVYVAVVDQAGLRLDENWPGTRVSEIRPGETVRGESSTVFWNLEAYGRPPVTCEIVAVYFDR